MTGTKRIVAVPGEGAYGEQWYYLPSNAPAEIPDRETLITWATSRSDPKPWLFTLGEYTFERRPDLRR